MALGDMLKGISDFMKQAGEYATETIGSVKDVYDAVQSIDGNDTSSGQSAQAAATTPITLGDFSFTPNWYLLFGGLALLIIALFLMRK